MLGLSEETIIGMLEKGATEEHRKDPQTPYNQHLLNVAKCFGYTDIAEKMIEQAKQRVTLITATRSSSAVASDSRFIADWYEGPENEHSVSWKRYKEKLLASPGMAKALPSIDKESTDIVSLLSDPNMPCQKKKGLVLGYVQSGKTANYAAVIAKAVDAGYRFIIVLAGMHTNLRQQTQKRLQRDLGVSLSAAQRKEWRDAVMVSSDHHQRY